MATAQDQQWVDDFLTRPNSDMPFGPSVLAERLKDPAMTPEGRDLLLQTIIRSDSLSAARLFGNDGIRGLESSESSASTALANDQRVIGAALGEAFASGAVTTNDLVRLGDFPDVGAAESRMVGVLQAGGAESRDALVAVAGELSTRNPQSENDKILSTMIQAEDPLTRSALGPDKARQAFEDLVEQSEKYPFDPNASSFEQNQQKHLITAATALYAEYGDELLGRYMGADGGNQHGEAEFPARFLSLTALDPNAQSIEMPDGRTVGETINATTDAFADKVLSNIENLNGDPQQQRDATRQLGRLHASMTAAEEIAENRHASEIAADSAVADKISSAAERLVSITPVSRIPGATDAAGAVAEAIVEGAQPDRAPPDSKKDGDAFDNYEDALGAIERRIGPNSPDIQGEFNDTRGHELEQIRGKLIDENLISASFIDHESHPSHSRYASCHEACERANLGLASAELTNVAGALTALSMADKLPRVDHVVSSNDATQLFAIAGKIDDPSHLRTMMPRDVAIHQTVGQSTEKVDALVFAQQKNPDAEIQLLQDAPKRGQMV
jgi:hypothetical protein